jgi:hypothetical protein
MGIHLSALVVVRNKNGKIVQRRKLRLHSATYQFAQFMYEMFTAQVSPSIQYSPITIQGMAGYTQAPSAQALTPSAGGVLMLDPISNTFGANGTLTQVANPIIGLGNGRLTFSPSIAQLAGPILIYSAYSSTEPTPNLTESSPPSAYANNSSISYTNFYFSPAIFQNNTSSTVTVSELGWYASLSLTSPLTAFNTLMTYDTISPSISIAPGGTLTITFTVELE